MRRAHVDAAVLDAAATAAAGDGALALPPEAAHRFTRVLRLPEGEQVELFDGTGRLARGALEAQGALGGARLVGVVVEQAGDPLPPLVLAQAAVATDKLELVVQKATELGASHIVLFDAARSQVRLKEDRLEKRQLRLSRIAEDAARQSGRASVPAISWAPSAAQVARGALVQERVAAGAPLVVGALDAGAPLSELLAATPDVERAGAVVVVGPEGGLDPREIAALLEAGGTSVRLGAHVLRTETAGLVALAAIQARLGHL
jgi:16S rRNA (uracil1498-N3)-methyltransferase